MGFGPLTDSKKTLFGGPLVLDEKKRDHPHSEAGTMRRSVQNVEGGDGAGVGPPSTDGRESFSVLTCLAKTDAFPRKRLICGKPVGILTHVGC